MIAISEQPKRFIAALNKFRKIVLTDGPKSIPVAFSKPVHCPTVNFSTSPYKPSVTPPPLSIDSSKSVLPTSSIRRERDIFDAVVFNPAKVQTSTTGTTSSVPTLKLHGPRELNWYTGKPPIPGVCPGVAESGYMYSLPLVTADAKTGKWSKQALQDYFDNTWTMTEVLLGALQGEEAFVRPPYHELRHPMIFYYGHPAVLYINKFRVAGLISDPVNPYFESIFETGVDEMSWDDLSKNQMPWPSVAEVRDYRAKVYKIVTKVIANLNEEQLAATGPESSLWAILMGFEHERIHIETSSVLINELPVQYVQFPVGMPAYHSSIPKESPLHPVAGKDYPVNEMIAMPAQRVAIGKPKEVRSFGWDNEYGYREYEIPAFEASKFKVSNGEFYEFVKENGYARPEFWSEAGWKWRAFRNAKWPTFWIRKGPQGHHQYDLRVLFDIVPMPWDWPVCVNYHEATAFANWKTAKATKNNNEKKTKKYRILTELEHRAIRGSNTTTTAIAVEADHAMQYSGQTMSQVGYNLNLAHSSMTPVNLYPPNEKGFHDVFGNAWEWTEDYFCALPGFEIHPYYEDFSTPCFDGLHHVIQGGSFISTGDEASVHSRYHFRPHFFQHASFRVVEQREDESEMVTSDMDAPGPYVGNYPYRRSQAKLMEQAKQQSSSPSSAMITGHRGLTLSQQVAKSFGLPTQSMKPYDALQQVLQQLFEKEFASTSSATATGSTLLEVGCGPGGLTFPMIRTFSTVIGVDHSMEAVSVAKTLLAGNSYSVELADQGERKRSHQISLPTELLQLIHPTSSSTTMTQEKMNKKIEFRCADPMCLPAEFHHFDAVILHDVLDQMSSPNALLGRLGGVRGLVKPGGLVVIISAFQWSETRTPKSLWFGGVANAAATAEEQLTKRLAADSFEMKLEQKMPILWQETMIDLQGKMYSVLAYKRMK